MNMKVKNQMNNSRIAGVCLLLLSCITGCDHYERKGDVTPDITVNEQSLNLFVGETAQLKASPVEVAFTWLSEDPEVATVDDHGLVTAVSGGATVIVARSGDMSCNVPVNSLVKIPLTGFSLNVASVEANPGTQAELWVIPEPSNANDASLPEWHSRDRNIATVDYKGVITGVNEGTVDVVCTINGIERVAGVVVWATKPFKGPHTLSADNPYTLKAVDFDYGGRGNAWNDNNTGANQAGTAGTNYRVNNGDNNAGSVGIEGAGNNLGYTVAGEWLVYTIQVEDAGDYKVEAEIACNGNSVYRIELDGVFNDGYWKSWIPVISSPQYASTGGWSNYQWKTEDNHVMTLTAGEHRIRFVFGNPTAFNFRNLRFTYQP
jgi:hypothetical protein